MNKGNIFWQSFLALEKELLEVSRFIYITDGSQNNVNGYLIRQNCKSQMETFSPHIADLLVRCCVQIESIAKELYFEIGGTEERGASDLFFDMECIKLIDIKWKLNNKVVLVSAPSFDLSSDENLILRPLRNAHKRQGTYWERAYQAVKHDRFSSLRFGNVKALIHALAALYLLNLYFRNDSWTLKYSDLSKHDYSMGSSVFSVKPPKTNQMWYGNNPIMSESPYVVQYEESVYRQIADIQQRENDSLNNYWMRQPELQEKAFLAQLSSAIERNSNGHKQNVMYMWELAKYRLNKKIPLSLPFLERKRLFVNTEEWNGRIRQTNNHLSEDELTEENIQHEIEQAAILWGIELERQFKKFEWVPIASNSGLCKVYIP